MSCVRHVKLVVYIHKFISKYIEISCRQVDIEVRSELKVDIYMSSVLKPWMNSHRGTQRRVEGRCINT